MGRAYKCDKCKELIDGTVNTFAINGSYATDITIYFKKYLESDDRDICDNCAVELCEELLVELKKRAGIKYVLTPSIPPPSALTEPVDEDIPC